MLNKHKRKVSPTGTPLSPLAPSAPGCPGEPASPCKNKKKKTWQTVCTCQTKYPKPNKPTVVNSLSPLEVLSVQEALRHPGEKTHSHWNVRFAYWKYTRFLIGCLCLQSCPVYFWVRLSHSTLGPDLPGKPSAPRSPLGPFRDTRFWFRSHSSQKKTNKYFSETFAWEQLSLASKFNLSRQDVQCVF